VVEGPFDAMKMGPGTVATMGTAWTTAQLKLLSGLQRVVVLFDSEPAAQHNAHALALALATMGVESEVTVLDDGTKDPGDLSERDASALRRELIGV
jgi:DNA primase